jgi:plastocyanin
MTMTNFNRDWATLCLALAVASGCGGGEGTPDAESGSQNGATAAPPPGVHGNAPSATGGTPSIVTLRPVGPAPALPARESPRMDQLGLAFTPMFLLARPGENVRFTNSETIAHNVTVAYSDNDSTVLDAETDPAAAIDLLMEREGGYEVSCDLHPGMRAFIFVTSAPYAAYADNSGAFSIADVPPGSYTLSVWNVDPARRSERTLEVTGPSTQVPALP